MSVEFEKNWDIEEQRRFWNDWDREHLSETTIGADALRRCGVALELLRSCGLRRPRIVEFGCGNGWLAEKLVKFGPVTGIDLADHAIEEARRRVPEGNFLCGDALNMDL